MVRGSFPEPGSNVVLDIMSWAEGLCHAFQPAKPWGPVSPNPSCPWGLHVWRPRGLAQCLGS